jgi:hypothetical protein
VQECLEQFAGSNKPVAAILDDDGPAVITIWRWIDGLFSDAVRGWVEGKLQALKPSWRGALQPKVCARWPRPPNARPEPWNRLQMARCLSLVLSDERLLRLARLIYAPVLQTGRLLTLRACSFT